MAGGGLLKHSLTRVQVESIPALPPLVRQVLVRRADEVAARKGGQITNNRRLYIHFGLGHNSSLPVNKVCASRVGPTVSGSPARLARVSIGWLIHDAPIEAKAVAARRCK